MKLLGWISKLLLGAILVSTISVLTTAYIVNTYITQLLKPFNLQISQKPLELSDILVNLWGKSNILGQGGTSPDATSLDPNPDPTSNPASTTPVGKEDAVAAWAQTSDRAGTDASRTSETSTERALDRAVVMSEDQLQSKKDQLTSEDKRIIFAALSKLPEADMQTISTLVEDGITSSELAQVEKIVEQQLKPEEYNQLLQILRKYE